MTPEMKEQEAAEGLARILIHALDVAMFVMQSRKAGTQAEALVPQVSSAILEIKDRLKEMGAEFD